MRALGRPAARGRWDGWEWAARSGRRRGPPARCARARRAGAACRGGPEPDRGGERAARRRRVAAAPARLAGAARGLRERIEREPRRGDRRPPPRRRGANRGLAPLPHGVVRRRRRTARRRGRPRERGAAAHAGADGDGTHRVPLARLLHRPDGAGLDERRLRRRDHPRRWPADLRRLRRARRRAQGRGGVPGVRHHLAGLQRVGRQEPLLRRSRAGGLVRPAVPRGERRRAVLPLGAPLRGMGRVARPRSHLRHQRRPRPRPLAPPGPAALPLGGARRVLVPPGARGARGRDRRRHVGRLLLGELDLLADPARAGAGERRPAAHARLLQGAPDGPARRHAAPDGAVAAAAGERARERPHRRHVRRLAPRRRRLRRVGRLALDLRGDRRAGRGLHPRHRRATRATAASTTGSPRPAPRWSRARRSWT